MLFLTGRKLESQQQSEVHPEKGHEMTDSMEIFFLPQYIRVMVSNYQPQQTIFAIDEGEYHIRMLKIDEQFSLTVTIVDAATRQPLDCVPLLHGEKPPEVTSRTLFCYIAVQVTYRDAHGSHPYPLYHVETKPCIQSKLPLIFHFHDPGKACLIQLSLHSIVDSDGVEYMYDSEDCDCTVQIIDRDQHRGVKTRDQHGVVRMKEPPCLKYTGPLATKKFHKLEEQFTKLFLSRNFEDLHQYSKQLSNVNVDIKVFALCWEALSMAYRENFRPESYSCLLRTAWELASKPECETSLLLQGRVLRHLAHLEYARGDDVKASSTC